MHNSEDRCEGTLIVHADGYFECSEPTCTDDVHHQFVVECDEIIGGCECAGTGAVQLAA